MANRKIKPAQLETALEEILQDYSEEVIGDTKTAVIESGKLAVEVARAHASGIGRGQYAKTIRSKVTVNNGFYTEVTVYSTNYKIAHLLEHGHVVKVRGRVAGTARAFPHFAPAEARAERFLENKVKQIVRGG